MRRLEERRVMMSGKMMEWEDISCEMMGKDVG